MASDHQLASSLECWHESIWLPRGSFSRGHVRASHSIRDNWACLSLGEGRKWQECRGLVPRPSPRCASSLQVSKRDGSACPSWCWGGGGRDRGTPVLPWSGAAGLGTPTPRPRADPRGPRHPACPGLEDNLPASVDRARVSSITWPTRPWAEESHRLPRVRHWTEEVTGGREVPAPGPAFGRAGPRPAPSGTGVSVGALCAEAATSGREPPEKPEAARKGLHRRKPTESGPGLLRRGSPSGDTRPKSLRKG